MFERNFKIRARFFDSWWKACTISITSANGVCSRGREQTLFAAVQTLAFSGFRHPDFGKKNPAGATKFYEEPMYLVFAGVYEARHLR